VKKPVIFDKCIIFNRKKVRDKSPVSFSQTNICDQSRVGEMSYFRSTETL